MINSIRFPRFATVLILLLLPTVLAAGPTQVDAWRPAEPPTEPKASLLMEAAGPGQVHRITLPAVPASEIEAMMTRNERQKRLEVGLARELSAIDRTLSAPDLYWRETGQSNRVASVVVESTDAQALRVALDVNDLPDGLVVRFHPEGDPDAVFGPYDQDRLAELARFNKAGIYWSPIVEGENLAMELSLPEAADVRDLMLDIPMVSHLVTSMRDGFAFKDLSGIGNSGACNVDIRCEQDTAWHHTGESVAKYAFTKSGSTYLCTGTLLNDEQDSGTPYFLSANHCVSDNTVAATLNTYWFFQRESCGGPDPDSVTQRSNGAQLLATGQTTDFTLMELNDMPPSGAVYAGWTTTAPAVGSEATALHHPSGDLKMISRGDIQGYSPYGGSGNDPDTDYIRMLWTVKGTTETGSSGSALFDTGRRVVGTLRGGRAGCEGAVDNGEPDWYGRFDVTHSCISDHLGGTPVTSCPSGGDGGGGSGDADDAIALNSGVSESGSVALNDWHLYRIDVPSDADALVVELTGMAADGDLYVRAGTPPGESNFDCRSWEGGSVDELCEIENPTADTWYVAINGYEATPYTVKATVESSGGGSGGGGGGSSSGGCSLVPDPLRDPLLPILLMLSVAGLLARRRPAHH